MPHLICPQCNCESNHLTMVVKGKEMLWCHLNTEKDPGYWNWDECVILMYLCEEGHHWELRFMQHAGSTGIQTFIITKEQQIKGVFLSD